MYSVQSISSYYFTEQFLCGIIHDGNVVGVPSDGPAHMEHQFWYKVQYGRYFICRTLSRMVMACVDGQYFPVFGSIGCIEIV